MIYSPGAGTVGSGSAAIAGSVIGQVPILDPQSSNICLRSSELDNATWTKAGGATVTADSTLAPNGITDADTLNDAGAGLGEANQNIAIANDALQRVFSVYVLPGTSTQSKVGLRLTGGAAPVDNFIEFNPQSGATLAITGTFSRIESVVVDGVTWFRVQIAAQNNGSGNVVAQPYIQAASAGAGIAGTLIVWGMQLEENRTAATGQIPTAATAVTRSAGLVPPWLAGAPGEIIDFGSAALPGGFIAIDGSNVLRTGRTARLFGVYGTTWGVGDGVTTFGLPDGRRRVTMGSGGAGTGVIGNATGNTGGAETLSAHTHTYLDIGQAGATIIAAPGAGYNTNNTGSTGTGAHGVIQPAMICTKGARL